MLYVHHYNICDNISAFEAVVQIYDRRTHRRINDAAGSDDNCIRKYFLFLSFLQNLCPKIKTDIILIVIDLSLDRCLN